MELLKGMMEMTVVEVIQQNQTQTRGHPEGSKGEVEDRR